MGRGSIEEADRNWAIWRRYRKGGLRHKDLAVEYNISVGRVQQIVEKCEKKARAALTHPFTRHQVLPEDSVRNGLLGVEFIFRADDPWVTRHGRGDWVDLDGSWFRYIIGEKR